MNFCEFSFQFVSLKTIFLSISSTQRNVAKRQFEWSKKKISEITTAALPSVSASQAVIALSEHSTESSLPNFSHQCAATVGFVCTREKESVHASAQAREETDRQR